MELLVAGYIICGYDGVACSRHGSLAVHSTPQMADKVSTTDHLSLLCELNRMVEVLSGRR